MSGNNFLTKHVLRRRVSEHRPYGEDSRNNDSSSSSSSDEDERSKKGSKGSKDKKGKDKEKGKKEKPEWKQVQDPYGRLCW
eukprot:jgi/Undpi1/895/HiC_scaffold_10.g04359.m1